MIETIQNSKQVEEHYGRPHLREIVLSALAAAGKDLNHLTIEDLAPLDEFHIRGRQATIELAEKLDLRPGLTVLDVGSGLGGPSRYLVKTYGCFVTGLDLTEEFCHTAQMLAEKVGLADLVEFKHGSALNMPFANQKFDFVWTQHASMNIGDKLQLYNEIFRVLKQGGKFALYDIMAGPKQPVHFPVPWARVPSLSYLIPPDDLRLLLYKNAFKIIHWQDHTETSRAFTQDMVNRARLNGSAPLGFQVFMGPEFRDMAGNVLRNLDENRIRVMEVICVKE